MRRSRSRVERAEQLGLSQPARFIHGFRRDNLAIEVVEIAPSQRAALTAPP